ncbi:hypothetical protein BDV98DRAFT_657940 [Pterulicium gracile]|uniref:Uncharacterized protein n=1 Tax=Pterulicium gracile TaxID=1884261 RepID=A0A5C3Q8X8_9AGAR|nr:hypothetical protein BDV98DRAFT_657940 [Pterula gracilis]
MKLLLLTLTYVYIVVQAYCVANSVEGLTAEVLAPSYNCSSFEPPNFHALVGKGANGLTAAEVSTNSELAASNIVHACADAKFDGICRNFEAAVVQACYNVPTYFQNVTSSIELQASGTGMLCYLYTARDCGVDIMCLDSTMRIDQLAYPFENRVRSFMCYF